MMRAVSILLLSLASCFAADTNLPPLPPGIVPNFAFADFASAVIPPATNPPSLLFITRYELARDTEIIECWVRTNRPTHFRIWQSETLTTNAAAWRLWSYWTGPSNRPIHMIPVLRDNARLLDWFVVRPSQTRFFRLEVLP